MGNINSNVSETYFEIVAYCICFGLALVWLSWW